MYKLTILFFLLITYSSQGLITSHKITFENKEATYILHIKEGSLVFENNQPNVTVTTYEETSSSSNTDKAPSAPGKNYKITKGGTWQDGLKIGAVNPPDPVREMNALLFETEDYSAYEISFGFGFVKIVEKATNLTEKMVIPESGLYVNVLGDNFRLFK